MAETVFIKCDDFQLNLFIPEAVQSMPMPKWKKVIKLACDGDFENPGQLKALEYGVADAKSEAEGALVMASKKYADGYVDPKRFYRIPPDVKRANARLIGKVKQAKAVYDRIVKIQKLFE